MVFLICYENVEGYTKFKIISDNEERTNKKYRKNRSDILKIYGKNSKDLLENIEKDYRELLTDQLIEYIKQYMGEDDNVKYEMIKKDTRLYHGSDKLFRIQCFIHKYRDLIDEYLSQTVYTEDLGTTGPLMRKRIKQTIDPGEHHDKFTWSFHLLFIKILYILKQRLEEGDMWIKVSSLLKAIYPNNKGLFVINFIEFAKKVESGHENFRPIFYSSMNQPVQFFSEDVVIPKTYSNHLYEYTLYEDIYILDLTDKQTVLYLKDNIFTDTNPISLEKLRYYEFYGGQRDIVEYRRDLLAEFCGQANSETSEDKIFEYTDQFIKAIVPYFRIKTEYDITTLPLETLSIDWDEYFEIEFLSVYGLFVIENILILENINNKRLSHTLPNSILIKTLREKTHYHGWKGNLHGGTEIMIIHPELYGDMVAYEDINFDNCGEDPINTNIQTTLPSNGPW